MRSFSDVVPPATDANHMQHDAMRSKFETIQPLPFYKLRVFMKRALLETSQRTHAYGTGP